jgi:hypothetical protein
MPRVQEAKFMSLQAVPEKQPAPQTDIFLWDIENK